MKKKILLNGIIVGEHESSGNYDEDILAVRSYLQTKGLWKNVSANDSMFSQANSFAETANVLYEKGLRKSPYNGSIVAPFIVNAAFSVEIYLKTILEAFGNPSRVHDLKRLFKSLNEEARAIVRTSADDVRARYKLEEDVTIETCIRDLGHAFVKWRYRYEHEKLSTEVQSIRFTMNTLFEATHRVRESLGRGA